MALPWLQIVQLVPSIVDVSRELLKRSKGMPTPPQDAAPDSLEEVLAHVVQLQENERRQAELIGQMAEQMAALTRAVTVLHKRAIWLAIGLAVATAIAIAALVLR